MNRRGPAGFLCIAALFWLAAGLALAGTAAAALAWPVSGTFCARALARCGPAGEAALYFGWASLAGAAVGLEILASAAAPLIWIAAVVWNGSLLYGVVGMLLGKEPGNWKNGLVEAAVFLAIGAWRTRRSGSMAVSYALAAFAALPLCLLGWLALSGTGMGAAVGAAWGDGAFRGLWLTPLALAGLYALWPDGKEPIPHAGPAAFGFLIQMGAAGWTGTAALVGGPVPLWIGSVGTAASLLMLLPALAIPLSLAEDGPRPWTGLRQSLAVAITAYVLFLVQGAWLALRGSNAWHLTLCDAAQAHLQLFGFFSVIFAAAPPRRFSGAAAWCGLGGLCILLGAEEAGGWLQAFAQTDPQVPWSALTDLLHPFLVLRVLGFLLMGTALFLRRKP